MYAAAVAEQAKEVDEVRREEALKIPLNIDYTSQQLNFGREEVEKLTMAQPQTVR